MEFTIYRFVERIPKILRIFIAIPCLLYALIALPTPLPFGTITGILGLACLLSAYQMVHIKKIRKGLVDIIRKRNFHFFCHKIKDFKRHIYCLFRKKTIKKKEDILHKTRKNSLYVPPKTIQHLWSLQRENNVPVISENNGKTIVSLLLASKASSLLELGGAQGFSSLFFKTHCPQLHITSLEKNEHDRALAKKNANALNLKVDFVLTDALLYTPTQYFDALFIDALKKDYILYLERFSPYVKKGGIIIIDDIIKFRHKMGDILNVLPQYGDYHIVQTDPDDGIAVVFTKNDSQ